MVDKFWDLDTIGIIKNELSVYDKFLENVKFINGRYEVCLPFKEERPFIEDNYVLCEKRLQSLKRKLEEIQYKVEEYKSEARKYYSSYKGIKLECDNLTRRNGQLKNSFDRMSAGRLVSG